MAYQPRSSADADIYSHLLKRHVYNYPENGTHKKWVSPQLMVLFESGDVNQVTEAIVNDLVHPIGSEMIACVLVEESIRDEVIKKIRGSLKPMDERLQHHPNYLKSVRLIDRMNCQTIHLEEYDESDTKKCYGRRQSGSPIVVLDFPQYFFGDKPTSIITMSTFRSLNEVVKLYKREGVFFDSVSVWSSKLAQCFDLMTRIPQVSQWCFNIRPQSFKYPQLPPQPFSNVTIIQRHHHETHVIGGKVKTITFPIKPEYSL
ncbi:hypothetical protein KR009_008270 [Drosophila setifemur]|nr:hypothetical protein KR009_008270 [Drosophila setifemur]